MVHPARKMVETLHAKGACPRIQVDSTRDGVVCPDFLREQWQQELIIDLDPSYPLNLSFTGEGIEVDLAFDGYVARCTFPFGSIYVVVDRETGKGIVINENMPESVRLKRQAATKPRSAADLRAQGKSDRAPGQPRRRRKAPTKPELGVAPEPADELPTPLEPQAASESQSDEAETRGAGDEEAKRRRSGFQVIDGDG